jgi:hypothetical protein
MPSLSRGRGRRTISEINMVPFIDVMLVLLIIFMVTAPLIAPSMIDLPSVGKAAKQPDQIVQIVIGKDESLELKTGDKSRKLGTARDRRRRQTGPGWPGQQRCGHQRGPQREIRDGGQGHGYLATRRHPARRPVRPTGPMNPDPTSRPAPPCPPPPTGPNLPRHSRPPSCARWAWRCWCMCCCSVRWAGASAGASRPIAR